MTETRHTCCSEFRFGDGVQVKGKCSWTYPVGVFGMRGALNIAEVDVDCPPLISLTQMGGMEILLDFKRNATTVQGICREMERMESGHPKVRIDEFVTEKLDEFGPQHRLGDLQLDEASDGEYSEDERFSEDGCEETAETGEESAEEVDWAD